MKRYTKPSARNSLPSISHLDFHRIKKHSQNAATPSDMSTMSISSALESPVTAYARPPSSYPTCTSPKTAIQVRSGYISPPESTTRRSTKEENEPPLPTKSLPSIHEALRDSSVLQNPFPTSNQSYIPKSATTSAVDSLNGTTSKTIPPHSQRVSTDISYKANPSVLPLSAVSARSDYSFPEPRSASVTKPDSSTYDISTYDTRNSHYFVSPRTSLSSPPRNSLIEHPNSLQSQNQPSASYRPEYSLADSSTSTHNLTPTARFANTSSNFHVEPSGKDQTSQNGFSKGGQVSYGETVKRHFDVYDAEYALNEMNDASTRSVDFARYWIQRYHQTNRFHLLSDGLPQLKDIDEMLHQSQRITQSLGRMREVIAQHHATISEERARAARISHHNEEYRGVIDEYKSDGFSGGDAKKRRGKAAPPGRCHGCNRAETPEWRRGPDGARTLCNACGLHYAKLTRKNRRGLQSGSTLRPTEM